MARKPENPEVSGEPFDDADELDLLPDMGDVIWEEERKTSRRGKRGMPEDEEPREFPKAIIYAIIALVVIIPAGIILYDTLNIGSQPSY